MAKTTEKCIIIEVQLITHLSKLENISCILEVSKNPDNIQTPNTSGRYILPYTVLIGERHK